ncbi:MAG: isochorismate synthase [Acidimicrobiales bacterium]
MRPPEPGSLRALTLALDPAEAAAHLSSPPGEGGLRFLSAGGLSFAGTGVAAFLTLADGLAEPAALDDVVAWLRAVPHDDRVARPGSAVSAHGALPFDRAAAGRLLVPRLAVAVDADGRAWATAVTPADRPLDEAGLRSLVASATADCGTASATDAAATAGVTAVPTPADHARSVGAALDAIGRGTLQKVVLARRLDVDLAAPPAVGDVLRRLRAQEPACTVFAVPLRDGWFVGASPELVVRRRSARVQSHPLAGTVGLSGTAVDDDAVRAFLESKKELAEHELVVEAIAAALRRHCDRLDVPAAPALVRLQSVAHLGTALDGHLASPDGPAHALTLLAALHPTPAVAGVPRSEALSTISQLEPASRGQWAGPVGWVDAHGDGEWMLGIRSATLSGRRAVLWAGGGIVAGSLPAAEVDETTLKLVPVLEAVAPGAGRRLQRL